MHLDRGKRAFASWAGQFFVLSDSRLITPIDQIETRGVRLSQFVIDRSLDHTLGLPLRQF